jgi:NADH-quinone oxidoreductase subunit A
VEPFTTSAGPGLSISEPGIGSLVVFSLLCLGLVLLLHFLASRLGEKKTDPGKLISYECGILPTGSARVSYPIAFYLTAVFFLIFDVEAAFIFSWAIALGRLGWAGWLQISSFILILLISLLYVWKKGGLEWGPKAR